MVLSDTASVKQAARKLAEVLPDFGAGLTYKQCLEVISRMQGFKSFEAARQSIGKFLVQRLVKDLRRWLTVFEGATNQSDVLD